MPRKILLRSRLYFAVKPQFVFIYVFVIHNKFEISFFGQRSFYISLGIQRKIGYFHPFLDFVVSVPKGIVIIFVIKNYNLRFRKTSGTNNCRNLAKRECIGLFVDKTLRCRKPFFYKSRFNFAVSFFAVDKACKVSVKMFIFTACVGIRFKLVDLLKNFIKPSALTTLFFLCCYQFKMFSVFNKLRKSPASKAGVLT